MRTCILILVFSVCTFVSLGQSISSAEYFFDTDPGIGNGTSVALNGNTGQLTQSLTIPTNGLLEGFHSFYVRTQSSLGNWSHYDRVIFYITNFSNTSGPIVAAEYFIDTDPGEGSGMSLEVNPNNGLLVQSFVIPKTGLTDGLHIYYIRVQDENGNWSLHDSAEFTILAPIDNSVTLENTTLTATYAVAGATYKWINCDSNLPIDGETNRSFNVLVSGSYAVEITNDSQTVISDCTDVVIVEPIGDDDGDGVPDDLDICLQTPENAVVDVTGCEVFSLSASNFRIRITGESCINSNNGSIQITAEQPLEYSATLTSNIGSTVNTFTADTLFENLIAGNYSLCIAVAGEAGYESCQEVIIKEPEALSVTSKIDVMEGKVIINLKGGKTYTVHLNQEVYTTSENEIIIPLSAASNSLFVKTDKECQGTYGETIVLASKTMIYPNPINSGDLTVYLGEGDWGLVEINLHSTNGTSMISRSQEVLNNEVKFNVDTLAKGMYMLSITAKDTKLNYKIIRL